MPDLPFNATVVEHPLLTDSLTRLRDATTDTATFRQHTQIASWIVALEAIRTAPVTPLAVATPLAIADGGVITRDVVFVPVLRAGIAMLEACRQLLPFARVGFIGLERDERTAVAREYYRKLPDRLGDTLVVVLDPMLATGGSLDSTLRSIRNAGGKNIVVACLVAAPEGLAHIGTSHPLVRVITAAIDKRLDEKQFIVPGLGDFGDRFFGT